MNAKPFLWIGVLVLGAIFGVALVAQSLTGQAVSITSVKPSSSTVLSALAAVLCIGVLIVAGLQKTER